MSNYVNIDTTLNQYIADNSVHEPQALAELRAHTQTLAEARMMTLPYQAQYLSFLLKLIKATRVIEIGVFTGYATAWMAQALPEDGQLVACDIATDWVNIGKPYWQALSIEKRIDLKIGDAIKSLNALLADNQQLSFDAIFIDADKTNYDTYYELSLELLRPGGLILFDNLLWSGKVANLTEQDDDTQSLRAITNKLHLDPRVDFSLITIADGLGLARKI